MTAMFTADSYLVSSVLPQPNHSGGGQSKSFIVLHDIECPPGAEWAESLGGPAYLQDPAEQHSVHYIVDADSVIQGLPEDFWAWGCGTPGSQHSIHIEQAGYASFTKAQWMGDASAAGTSYVRSNGDVVTYTAQDAADMKSQMVLVAKLMADIIKRHGWVAQWASGGELVSASNGADLGKSGTHADVSEYVGGTNHSDPGSQYPRAELMAMIASVLSGSNVPTTPPADTGDLEMNEEVTAAFAALTAQIGGLSKQVEAMRVSVLTRTDKDLIPRQIDIGDQNGIIYNRVKTLQTQVATMTVQLNGLKAQIASKK